MAHSEPGSSAFFRGAKGDYHSWKRPMASSTTTVDVTANGPHMAMPAAQEPDRAALEQRLQRLENAIAGMLDTKAVEERIAARLSEQIHQVKNDAKHSAPPEAIAVGAPARDPTLAAVSSLAAALNSPLLNRPSQHPVF